MNVVVQQTKQRLLLVRRLIASIGQRDFPYDDSKAALQIVDRIVADQLNTLDTQITEDSSTDNANNFCRSAMSTIAEYAAVLGLIARSSEPVGAIDLQWPLKQLTKKALGDGARLVISSDWNYSPVTLMPSELLALHDVVLIGMPVAEANNVLLTPLAGHELGHNIWLKHSLRPQVTALIKVSHDKAMKDQRWNDLHSDVWDVVEHTFEMALYQAQELFCDMIGLLMFRESYLHAFRYYLATDQEIDRADHYPSMYNRVVILKKCAEKRRIAVPEHFVESFDKPNDLHAVTQVIDEISNECADDIYELATKLIDQLKLDCGSPQGVEKILKCFRELVPACNVASLQDIVNAAWRFELENEGKDILGEKPGLRETSLVSELAFKTCEVFQIEQELKNGP